MMKTYKSIIEEFVTLRKQQHVTQSDVAARTGIKQSGIARLENGGTTPTIQTLLQLGQALGYTLEWKKITRL